LGKSRLHIFWVDNGRKLGSFKKIVAANSIQQEPGRPCYILLHDDRRPACLDRRSLRCQSSFLLTHGARCCEPRGCSRRRTGAHYRMGDVAEGDMRDWALDEKELKLYKLGRPDRPKGRKICLLAVCGRTATSSQHGCSSSHAGVVRFDAGPFHVTPHKAAACLPKPASPTQPLFLSASHSTLLLKRLSPLESRPRRIRPVRPSFTFLTTEGRAAVEWTESKRAALFSYQP
jgi:hypothetical protein